MLFHVRCSQALRFFNERPVFVQWWKEENMSEQVQGHRSQFVSASEFISYLMKLEA